ncbi:hypothetical protein [Paraburkholderia unamae]|uniref:hypothetical protein n=1 Tax=Paraburkholderia unamae TaxID=219649 RepID=UPI0011BEC479|nr:hypothetical protein [Paraburkholderia unamae]
MWSLQEVKFCLASGEVVIAHVAIKRDGTFLARASKPFPQERLLDSHEMREIPCRDGATALDAFLCVLSFVKHVAQQSGTRVVAASNSGTFGLRGKTLAESAGIDGAVD